MSIRSIDTLDGLDGIRAFWEAAQDHLNNDLGQYRLVCALRPEVEAPLVVVVEQDGVPRAALVCRLERQRFAPAIGYFRPARLTRTVIAVLHQGGLGALDADAARGVFRFLRTLLRAGVADAIAFHPQPERSPLFEVLARERPRGLGSSVSPWTLHHEMALGWRAGRFDEHKLNAKHRSSFRRRQKELAAAFPGRLHWRWVSACDDVPTLCKRLEPCAAITYQRGLGAGFVDDAEHRRRFAHFAACGQLRIQLLEIDGTVRAFWYGVVYAGVFHAAETGYDPALGRFEVGTLLLARLADALAAEGVAAVDFGIGDAPYKARFGDRSWREASAWVFAPSLRGRSMGALLAVCNGLDGAGRRLAERSGVTAKLKAWWRRRLRPVPPPAPRDAVNRPEAAR